MDRRNRLVYVTGNELKFKVALQALQGSGILLERKPLNVPEIQSDRVEEVAEWSAVWASQHLDQPVVVMDAGYSIEALNGFPGPFVRFVNEWFSADDYLNLLREKNDRRATIRDCLAYCCPGGEPVSFCQVHRGELATQPGKKGGTPMDQIFIPEGYSMPISEIHPDEMIAYWSSAAIWQKLRLHLSDKQQSALPDITA